MFSKEAVLRREPIPLRDFAEVFQRPRNNQEIFIWDGGQNTFGTWKDLKAEWVAQKVRERGIDTVMLITAGNAGYAVAKFLEGTRTKTVLIIDPKTPAEIKKHLYRAATRVLETDLSTKLSEADCLALLREKAPECARGTVWDVTAGCEEAYEPIVAEIKHVRPELVVVPVGQGEGLIGICKAVAKHNLKTRVLGVAPLSQKYTIARNLVSEHPTPYLEQMAQAILPGAAGLAFIPEHLIRANYAVIQKHTRNFNCDESSAIVFAAALYLRESPWQDARAVFINSGKLKPTIL